MKKILYFSSDTCGPCKMLAPLMEELAAEIPVEKINVSINMEMATKYDIRSVPTVIIIRDEQEVARTVGAKPKNYYINQYNKN